MSGIAVRNGWFGGVKTALCAAAVSLALLAAAPSPAAAQGISLVRDAETEQLLRDFTNPILVAANIDPASVRIYLVQDRSLNAFVALGQNIFIHTGLILAADTPGQLKGVIAHETGHIAGGHLARSQEAAGQSLIPVVASILLGAAAIATGAPDAGFALISGAQQFGQANFVRYTQVQESSADQAGATYLRATEQNPEGLLKFFEKFRYAEVVSATRVPPYFRTHPISSDRIESLRERIRTAPQPPEDPDDVRRFELVRAKLRGYLDAPGITFSRYPSSDTSEAARYARAYAAYRAPDLKRAQEELAVLLQMQPDNPFYPELMGQLLFEHQRAAEAVPYQRRALELLPNSALFQVALARSLMALETPAAVAEADSLLRRATATEPDNTFAWSELAKVQDRQQQPALARLSIAEAYFTAGIYDQALEFAERAKREGLETGQVSWRRAQDISDFAKVELSKRRR
jgi:predicted Zn-dependent protease